MKLTPLFDRVVIRRDESEAKSPGGIILPEQAQQKSRQGKDCRCRRGKIRGRIQDEDGP